MTDRELDARVAVAMGFYPITQESETAFRVSLGDDRWVVASSMDGAMTYIAAACPAYSLNINAAMRIIEAVKAKGKVAAENLVDALCDMADDRGYRGIHGLEWFLLHCPNPARAICEAALAAEVDRAV